MNKVKQRVVVVLKAIWLVISLGLLRPIQHLCRAIWAGCKAVKLYFSYSESPFPTKEEWKEYIDHLKEEWGKK